MTAPASPPLDDLLTAAAVRARSADVLAAVAAGDGLAFRLDRTRLEPTADFVAETTREAYPDLAVPPHSRWRHFIDAAGVDRWTALAARVDWPDARSLAMARIDLAFVSVLLDAGAGAGWRYRRADGDVLGRSEGLAAASLDMFAAGLFSSDPAAPLRVDAAGLAGLTVDDLARGLQSGPWAAGPDSQVVGLAGRCRLLANLAAALDAAPDVFGDDPPRPGGLFDWVAAADSADAPDLLTLLLRRLGDMWPSGARAGGMALGDVGRHPAVRRPDPSDALLPFHKLSQWLVYSLTEPFADGGRPLANVNRLTGLAEYRNGGLLVDLGVLTPLDDSAFAAAHRPEDPLVVEWRALTVALLDDLAPMVRDRLDAPHLDLPRLLQGGTWAAGRRIAADRRPGGGPPFRVASDGTLF